MIGSDSLSLANALFKFKLRNPACSTARPLTRDKQPVISTHSRNHLLYHRPIRAPAHTKSLNFGPRLETRPKSIEHKRIGEK